MKNKSIILFFLIYQIFTYSQVANQPSSIEKCDEMNDSIETFDLTINSPQILGSQSTSQFTISFYVTLTDANNANNTIIDPTSYINTTLQQTIFARVDEISSDGFDITSFEIIVNPTPQFEIENEYFICENNSEYISIEPMIDNPESFIYNWYFEDDINTIISYDPSFITNQIGNYGLIVYSDNYECSTNKTFEVRSITDCSLNNNEQTIRPIIIYPNPTNSTLNIKINFTKNTEITIYDFKGEIVINQIFNQIKPIFQINIENLKSGIYFLKLKNNELDFKYKFIKK